MPKTSYSATFSDGTTITRNSERAYTHAWKIVYTYDGKRGEKTGFASSAKLAHAAKMKEAPAEWDAKTRKFKSDQSLITFFEVAPIN